MPMFSKDKKEGNLDPPIIGQASKTPKSGKESDVLKEVKLGIDRLSSILATYLSSFEERMVKIEKQIVNLDTRITNLEKGGVRSGAPAGGIRVPLQLVEDATRAEPIMVKKQPEPPPVPAATLSPEVTKPTTTIQAESYGLGAEVSEAATLTRVQPATPPDNIPLSREAPIAENFFDELRTRIDRKSAQLSQNVVYQPKKVETAEVETRKAIQTISGEAYPERRTEEDIKAVLQRLRESIKKAE
ncbi:MAG: hypothetical protein KIH08_13350 [Candidatus Freyarchaeota archaeon]|nr:hypothetical protein [Candidatus Jordarchaeia archaeon]MBS7269757.1 hypothetical protein [Candidatus Jordarchaeia archaeon]MBS7281409.1 hypothetical protein [Candidatus Jordarchaeia archaeon]